MTTGAWAIRLITSGITWRWPYRLRDHSYEEEMRIFDLLYAYMRPDSPLELDINKPGGMARLIP